MQSLILLFLVVERKEKEKKGSARSNLNFLKVERKGGGKRKILGLVNLIFLKVERKGGGKRRNIVQSLILLFPVVERNRGGKREKRLRKV